MEEGLGGPDVLESLGWEAGLAVSRAFPIGFGLYWVTRPPKLHRTPMIGNSVAEVAMRHP